MTGPSLSEWNYQVLMLMQASLGSISPNFRAISIDYINDEWVLNFYIEHEDGDDIDEIDEIVCQYMAYQEWHIELSINTIVGCAELKRKSNKERIVFLRRG